MANCGIPRIDQLLAGSPGAQPIAPGDADHAAVGGVQDLLAGHGGRMPNLAQPGYGAYGPQTTAAVRKFRSDCGLPPADTVDTPTLQQLVGRPAADPRSTRPYLSLALDFPFSGLTKILCCVAQVEGAGRFAAINANTDRQGLSYGLIQWAQGQVRLPELLDALGVASAADVTRIFGDGDAAVADGLRAHVRKTRGGTNPDGTTTDPRFDLVHEPWVGRFKAAGVFAPFQKVQVTVAVASLRHSLTILRTFAPDMTSERCVAFMLDLANQHGDGGARSRYQAARKPGLSPNEILAAITADDPVFDARHRFYLDTDFLSDAPFADAGV
jgi:hypothetical protein